MKYLFTIALALALGAKAQAQSVSIRAGANFSNIVKTDDDNFKTEFKPGFHAGLGIDIPVIAGFSLAPEILYSQKGYKATATFLGSESKYTLTTNHIDVPILVKFGSSGFNIHLGPQVSFLTSSKQKFDDVSQEQDEDIDLKKNIISGVAGIGIDVSSKVSLIGRYAIDFQKNNGDGNSERPEYKNQVIQVGLGIKL